MTSVEQIEPAADWWEPYASAAFCVNEWTARATTREGRRIEWDGVDVLPIRDGLIARKDVYSTSHIPRFIDQ
jgi:hypothetical protein